MNCYNNFSFIFCYLSNFNFSIYESFEKKLLEGAIKNGATCLSELIKSLLRQYVKEKEELYFCENQTKFYENPVKLNKKIK